MSVLDLKIAEIHELLNKKEITVSDLVKESLSRIKANDDNIQAFLTVDEENALAKAKELDGTVSDSVLYGIPAAIKDNIVTKDLRTTAASKMLENFNPIYDATVMQKLHEASVVTVGKTNLDEFAMGSTTETSAFQVTKNPWNVEHVPGGSSGGSAAAVAAGYVPFALGSDTGGSIRQPAAFCGVVGLKPTYGRVSRFGAIAFGSSLDTIGSITRNVEDSAYVLQAIAGIDPADSTSMDVEVPNYVESLTGDVKGLKIAVPKEYLGEGVSEEARQSVLDALKVLEGLGATWEEVSLPHAKYAVPTYHVISSAEASANLARFDGVRYGYRSENAKNTLELYTKTRAEGFGDEVKRRIMLGTFVLSAESYEKYYRKAQQARTLITQDFTNVFADFDVIIGPTTSSTAYKIDGKTDSALSYAGDLLTVSVNLAGVPAITVPSGVANGLPLGLQVIGKHFDEQTILRVAHAFEQATDFHTKKPQL